MSAIPPAAQRRAARAARRDDILDAALEAFAQTGYEGASLARVAESVHMSTAGLLHHFPSKRDLLLAAVQRKDERDREFFELAAPAGLAALDHLADLVDANAERAEIVRSFAAILGESVAEHHPANPHFQRRYDRIREELASHLDHAIASGDMRADADPALIASEVYALMDGLQMQWLHNPQAVPMGTIFREYIRRLKADLST